MPIKQTVLVTGAGRGIGLELVKTLLSRGQRVLALSKNTESLKALKNSGLNVISVDLSSVASIAEAVESIKALGTHVDAVVHNAGSLIRKPFEETSVEDFQSIYQVNVFAPAELTRLLIPLMKPGSRVVAIGSMGGAQGTIKFGELSAYSSSKGALTILMEVLAEAYKHRSISFNTLALGSVDTEMFTQAFPEAKASESPTGIASYIADFVLVHGKFFNGKTLQVSTSSP